MMKLSCHTCVWLILVCLLLVSGSKEYPVFGDTFSKFTVNKDLFYQEAGSLHRVTNCFPSFCRLLSDRRNVCIFSRRINPECPFKVAELIDKEVSLLKSIVVDDLISPEDIMETSNAIYILDSGYRNSLTSTPPAYVFHVTKQFHVHQRFPLHTCLLKGSWPTKMTITRTTREIYISDSGMDSLIDPTVFVNALVGLDLDTGDCIRVFNNSKFVMPDPTLPFRFLSSDKNPLTMGIHAITASFDDEYVYFASFNSDTLCEIAIDVIWDSMLNASNHVSCRSTFGNIAGLEVSCADNVFLLDATHSTLFATSHKRELQHVADFSHSRILPLDVYYEPNSYDIQIFQGNLNEYIHSTEKSKPIQFSLSYVYVSMAGDGKACLSRLPVDELGNWITNPPQPHSSFFWIVCLILLFFISFVFGCFIGQTSIYRSVTKLKQRLQLAFEKLENELHEINLDSDIEEQTGEVDASMLAHIKRRR
ncbi:hypothetical protein PCE1_002016 [Barthelona sp. PCE]